MALMEPYLRHYGLFALLVIIYLESLGAPLPGESALIGAALLAADGQLPIVGVFLVVVVAAVAGDSTGYLIGRYGGRAVIQRFGRYIGLTDERQRWIEGLYEKHGALVVVGARFVVVLRQLNGIAAGTMAMRWHAFFIANLAGALLWAAVWTTIPYFFGDVIAQHFGLHPMPAAK
ncbi:DedA family protein [Martelella endophytica]|uniref:DedA family protein n=1 Tax=Martelella endophytica TaxID=1486262 RepID=UPI003CC79DE1